MCTKCKKDICCCPKNYRGRKGPAGQRGPRGLQGLPGEQGAPGPVWMSWSWAVIDVPYKVGGAGSAYADYAEVIYPGTTFIAAPTVVSISSFCLDPGPDYDVELYDVTTGLVVAFKYNIANITSTVIDTLTVTSANWPATRSRLRLRIRNNAGGNNRVAFSSMTWE